MNRVLAVAGVVGVAVTVHLWTRPPAPRALHPEVSAQNDNAIARGAAVYAKYGCATCHGADGKGGFPNPNAETDGKVPGVVFVTEGYTRKELRQKIGDGLATIGKADQKGPRPPYRMPGWAGHMTERETADLVEFLFRPLIAAAQGGGSNAPQREGDYVGAAKCISCHEVQGKGYRESPHARQWDDRTPAAAQGCETCLAAMLPTRCLWSCACGFDGGLS